MSHFLAHIRQKANRCALSIVDLLHVSNFKGGNASITEDEPGLSNKLNSYTQALTAIAQTFDNRSLRGLTGTERAMLESLARKILAQTKDHRTKIRGFGPSCASALLSAYFLELLPVLDRRVLNGAGIPVTVNSQGQVKNIAGHYPVLIEAFHNELHRHPNLTMRQIDRAWFCVPLPEHSP